MDKKIFVNMREKLSPDDRLVQQVLSKAHELQPDKEITMTDKKIKSNKGAFVSNRFSRYAFVAALAVVAVGASVMIIRNAGKLPKDESAANIVPGASSSREDTSTHHSYDTDSRPYSQPDDSDDYIMDIPFSIDKSQAIVDKEDKQLEVLMSATLANGDRPEKIAVIESYGANSTVAYLYDSGDYEKDGDKIKGDGVYSCRYSQQFDFSVQDNNNTDDNEKFYIYSAAYVDDARKTHISAEQGLTVYIHSSDDEKNALFAMTEMIKEIKNTDHYKNSDDEGKKQLLLNLLYDLAEKGTEKYPFSFMNKDEIKVADDNGHISIRVFGRIPMIVQIKPVDSTGLRY